MFFLEDQKCTGCMACTNICPVGAITIEKNSEGFETPVVDNTKCVKCNLCKKVCTVLNTIENPNNNEMKVYAAQNKDEDIRAQSSSGGVFTLVAEEILKQDGVIFGAGFNENLELKHIQITDIEELYKLRGSKYLQSSIGNILKDVKNSLVQGKKVLFTGTPCQVEGLRSYLGKEYENLYTMDFICHGVPSPKVWEKYKKYKEEKQKDKLKSIFFRDKTKDGWSQYHVKYEFENTVEYVNHNEDAYMNLFLNDLNLRESCYECKFKKEHRNSDITVADYWGINNINKEINDEKGLSAVIINSEKGNKLFDNIKTKIKYNNMNIEGIKEYNPSIIKACKFNLKRIEFFDDLEKNTIGKIIEKYL